MERGRTRGVEGPGLAGEMMNAPVAIPVSSSTSRRVKPESSVDAIPFLRLCAHWHVRPGANEKDPAWTHGFDAELTNGAAKRVRASEQSPERWTPRPGRPRTQPEPERRARAFRPGF